MTETTITRAELSEAVRMEVDLSRSESCELLDAVLHEIVAALADGRAVKISGFATFATRTKVERIGRNPKTGEAAHIPPRTVAAFHASQILKRWIRDGFQERRRRQAGGA